LIAGGDHGGNGELLDRLEISRCLCFRSEERMAKLTHILKVRDCSYTLEIPQLGTLPVTGMFPSGIRRREASRAVR
jgi:hypothetical protein